MAIAIVLFCAPMSSLAGRFLVSISAAAAIATVAVAVEAGYRERRIPEHTAIPDVSRTSTVPQPPRYQPEFEPVNVSVPRIGRGSKAQRSPWRLPAQPSPVSGIVADEAVLGALTVRAASLVGPGHRSADPATVRQDAYRLGRDVAGEHLVIAVADGVSSSRRSDLGATVAVSAAVASAVELLRAGYSPTEQWAPTLFSTVAQRIRQEAADRSLFDDDVCTVLITAILPARPREDGPWQAWIGWLGDVSLWQLSDGRWRHAAGDRKRDDGGIASNSLSAVLPRSPEAAQGHLLQLSPGSVLTFVTDGVGDGLAGLPDLNNLLASRWASPPPIADFINHVGYDAEQFHDDRSAVTVWIGMQQPAPRFMPHFRPQPTTRPGRPW